MSVLAWRFGYIPALMIDTMGMARATLAAQLKSLSLDSVARHLGLGIKGKTVHKVIGMGAAAIKAAGLYDEYAAYSCDDVDLCRGIYRRLMRDGFPPKELRVMDMILRCCVMPRFQLNQTLLAEHLHEVQQAKVALLDRAGLASRDELMSNDKFAEALRRFGVEPPMKVSKVTGKTTYAFAKQDIEFLELEEHDDPMVQALVAARLGVKSTIEETRAQRFISISHLPWPVKRQRLMPMPLRYSGAHTHRLSGDWKLNVQNLSRGGKLRHALEAPDGHTVVTVDASQIEARLVAWYCGAWDLVEAFANKEDVYSSFASKVFGFPVNKKEYPTERFVGKQGILGLGFGLGHFNFQKRLRTDSRLQTGNEINLSDEESERVVSLYRVTYQPVPSKWKVLGRTIQPMTFKDFKLEDGPVTFGFEHVLLPNGLKLFYHSLHQQDGEWWFTYNGKPKKLYGGKFLENIIQALARIIVMDAAVRAEDRLLMEYGIRLRLALQVHDELVFVVPTHLVETVRALLLEEMRRVPTWGPGIPLDAEDGVGATYGDAK
jgi:DNA polymerase